jgi:K+ transporter
MGMKSNLISLNLGFNYEMNMDALLKRLEEEGILHGKRMPYGVMPLSSNTLFVNRLQDRQASPEKAYKGRLYVSLAHNTWEQRNYLYESLTNCLLDMGYKVFV